MPAVLSADSVPLELLKDVDDVLHLVVEEAHLHLGILMQLEMAEEMCEYRHSDGICGDWTSGLGEVAYLA